jgi:hypothetical protein
MGSVNQIVGGAKRPKHYLQNDSEISKAAKRLVDRHGSDADVVAARRADALFGEGNFSEGDRWLEIFRSIATSYPRC